MGNTDDLALAEAMRAATGHFVRRTRQGTGTMSDARAEVLGHIDRTGAPLSAADLSRLRGVTHQSTRTLLSDMQAEGLVEGSPDPRDGRAILFAITSLGSETLRASRAARTTWLAENWVDGLSAEERTALRLVIRAMQRLR